MFPFKYPAICKVEVGTKWGVTVVLALLGGVGEGLKGPDFWLEDSSPQQLSE